MARYSTKKSLEVLNDFTTAQIEWDRYVQIHSDLTKVGLVDSTLNRIISVKSKALKEARDRLAQFKGY